MTHNCLTLETANATHLGDEHPATAVPVIITTITSFSNGNTNGIVNDNHAPHRACRVSPPRLPL